MLGQLSADSLPSPLSQHCHVIVRSCLYGHVTALPVWLLAVSPIGLLRLLTTDAYVHATSIVDTRNINTGEKQLLAIDYLPLLILLVIAAGFAAIAIGLPSVLGPRIHNPQKLEPYESGIIPYHDARRRVPIKYYLIAMLFILFDIEVIFMFPWAAILRDLRDNFGVWMALGPMGFFLLILIIGLLDEWKKGALDVE